jgi:hypothetical protein
MFIHSAIGGWTALISLLLLIKHLGETALSPWRFLILLPLFRMNFFVKMLLVQWLNEPFHTPDY